MLPYVLDFVITKEDMFTISIIYLKFFKMAELLRLHDTLLLSHIVYFS